MNDEQKEQIRKRAQGMLQKFDTSGAAFYAR